MAKYIVFKMQDYVNWKDKFRPLYEESDDLTVLAIDDAVVIRLQDVFAAHALSSYANGIGLVVHLLKMVQAGKLDLDQAIVQLQGPADYFHEVSEQAFDEHTHRKLPDE